MFMWEDFWAYFNSKREDGASVLPVGTKRDLIRQVTALLRSASEAVQVEILRFAPQEYKEYLVGTVENSVLIKVGVNGSKIYDWS